MKRLLGICMTVLFLTGTGLYAQSQQDFYLGVGFGMDHGGIGIKAEYLPVKHLGIFGGLGYNLLSVGWNLGATYKILPDKRVSPNIVAFYGYNGIFKGQDNYASKYDMTSYGITLGADLDIKVGNKGNKITIGLFVPIRSEKFMDNYDAAKADPKLEIKNELLPVAFSVGFNFLIH